MAIHRGAAARVVEAQQAHLGGGGAAGAAEALEPPPVAVVAVHDGWARRPSRIRSSSSGGASMNRWWRPSSSTEVVSPQADQPPIVEYGISSSSVQPIAVIGQDSRNGSGMTYRLFVSTSARSTSR